MKLAAREAQVEIEEFKKERESWLRASIPQVMTHTHTHLWMTPVSHAHTGTD